VPLGQRISVPLIRIVRTYVILITISVALLITAGSWFYLQAQLQHQRDLVLTRLATVLAGTSLELDAWASAPSVQTALMSPQGRDSNLGPLLASFQRGEGRTVTVHNGQERSLLTADAAMDSPIPDLPQVRQAMDTGRQWHGVYAPSQGPLELVLVRPVMGPLGDRPMGFLIAALDVPVILRELAVGSDVTLAVSLGAGPVAPTRDGAWHMRVLGERMVIVGEGGVPVRVALGRPVYRSALLLALVLAFVMGLGWWTLRRLEAWARGFAASTTGRFEQLVRESRLLLAGGASSANASTSPDPPAGSRGIRDELSEAMDAVARILRQQKTLNDTLRKTSLVFSTAAEGILVTSPDGRIVDVNRALTQITGYQRDELIGRPVATLYRSPWDDRSRHGMAVALEDEARWGGETQLLARDGQTIPATVSMARMRDDHGLVQGDVTVITDVSALKQAEAKLRELAYHDALTGLSNFQYFSDQARELLTRSVDTGQCYAILFIDMDRLKFINDAYGHEAGDRVLKALARHLGKALPSSHRLCRRSGDEFIALVSVSAQGGELELERLLGHLNPVSVDLPIVGRVSITATVGGSRFPQDGRDWDLLLQRANIAMNEAKQHQRSSLSWFDTSMGRRASRQRSLQGKLARAIETRALQVHYQPEVNLQTGAVIGFEALARWTDPQLGVIEPTEFIPVAEEARLIEQLSLQVVQTVLWEKASIQSRFPRARVAVNLSPRALLGQRLLGYLQHRASLDPRLLRGVEIELTETQLASTEATFLQKLHIANGLGLQVVIDDFGTGHSSLSRLTQFPISRLKIDRSFVVGLEIARQSKLVRLIIHMARVMGLEVTAEGVETEAQRALLLEMGCVRAQGWLFAPAAPLEQILALPRQLRQPALA
jgi:diguanylate cyclase (GGDEF)-like protein/PAS domain S-box-containing protein